MTAWLGVAFIIGLVVIIDVAGQEAHSDSANTAVTIQGFVNLIMTRE